MGAASLLAVEDDNRQAHPEPASRARALPAFMHLHLGRSAQGIGCGRQSLNSAYELDVAGRYT